MRNAINWFEIPVTNLEKAVTFYTHVLGQPMRPEDAGGRPSAVFAYDGTEAIGGALIEDPHQSRGAGVVIYLDAPDGVDQSLARATAAGAKTRLPATSIGPNGWIVLIEDLDGNVVGLHSEQR
jgi:predicted enzyme related to lactoylglutathione lyase